MNFYEILIHPPFSGIKNKWIRENLSLIPLALIVGSLLGAQYVFTRATSDELKSFSSALFFFFVYFLSAFVYAYSILNTFLILGEIFKNRMRSRSFRHFIFFLTLIIGAPLGEMLLQFIVVPFILNEEVVFRDMYRSILFNYVIGTPMLVLYLKKDIIESRYATKLLHSSELEKNIVRARLNALESKIQPHFLYNVLNSLSALVEQNNEKAQLMIQNISQFFRSNLDERIGSLVPLSEEVKSAKNYVNIEKIRYGDKLKVNFNIEKGLEEFSVPGFILQPLLENAIIHGTSKINEVGIIKITIRSLDEFLSIIVQDNGQRFKSRNNFGVGLSSIEEKLQLIYGNNYTMEIDEENKMVKLNFSKYKHHNV